ncbi:MULTISPECIES: hypothetical protein [Virgibacillus]|uniref:Uncharacterized protein n=2 Tax=Virgibacillus TaxID=84406 RepID=A0A024Q9W6_9BACI|nr:MULTISPECIES: hypothetical protein [Virgibacillus]EQB37518.1 hypothetical protein M948_02935 [Virgibacillus sp. CM-4]MYL40268.1 hypothetical protein [Virgibacillus massiliensis]GGJ60381.1 hypothetical protein GCM10007111_23050 [Virgibacillus kapii]CDQ38965.1 hypothetical protein BN990_01245 [Virgibacillus massiliensis]
MQAESEDKKERGIHVYPHKTSACQIPYHQKQICYLASVVYHERYQCNCYSFYKGREYWIGAQMNWLDTYLKNME